jgi:hypothetical protein
MEERIRRDKQREGRHWPEHSANLVSINFKALLAKLWTDEERRDLALLLSCIS